MDKPLTKKDVKSIIEEIVEKNNEKLIGSIKDEILTIYSELGKIHTKLEQHDKRFVKLENNIVQFKDEILHEIVDLRDEVAVVMGYREMLEDHDTRIDKLEVSVFPGKVSS